MQGNDPFPRALVPKADLSDKGGVTDWEFTAEESEAKALEFTRTYGGAHLLCPFQCEECHFENIHQFHTNNADPITSLKKKAMRRALLDAFGARAESTITSNAAKLKEILEASSNIRMPPPTDRVPRGPFPVTDQDGMSAAILMLLSSLNPGINSDTIQWATIRSIRSALSNYHRTTPEAQTANVEADEPKGSFCFTDAPTSSRWFNRFSTGMHARLGDVVIQDKALTVDELKALHQILEEHWTKAYESQDQQKMFEVAMVGSMSAVAFGGALRGEELAFVRVKESLEHTFEGRHHGRRPHLTVCLEGKFKTEKGRKKHFLALAMISKSGIKYGHWFIRLLWLYASNEVKDGPMFKTKLKNKPAASIAALDKLWLPYLKEAVPIVFPSILPENVTVDGFSCRRSFRRGATTQAQNVQLPESVINTNNRWRQVDKSGLRVNFSSLIQTYTDMVAAIDARLVFSESL